MKQMRKFLSLAAVTVFAVSLFVAPSYAKQAKSVAFAKTEQGARGKSAKGKAKTVARVRVTKTTAQARTAVRARTTLQARVIAVKGAKSKTNKALRGALVHTKARKLKAQARELRAARIPKMTQGMAVRALKVARSAAPFTPEDAPQYDKTEPRSARMMRAVAQARADARSDASTNPAVYTTDIPAAYAVPVAEGAAPANASPSYDPSASLLDALGLDASAAIVVDQDSREILARKNERMQLPMASVTKVMTAVVLRDAGQPLDELLTIQYSDLATLRGARSRLRAGDTMTRGELMQLMLMSSENLAAHTLANNYPGGMEAFIVEMRLKAKMLGMMETYFADPSGLSSSNRSTARDLAILLDYASKDARIRQFSTWPGKDVFVQGRFLQYHNTNALVHSPDWSIGMQKTGYISAAGYCLVMQTNVGGRNVLMVFLDATDKRQRLANAVRVRDWVLAQINSRLYMNVGLRANSASNAFVQP